MRRAVWVAAMVLAGAVAQAQAPKYAFDVVSIKPYQGVDNRLSVHTSLDGFQASGVRLEDLVRFAYGMYFGDEVTGCPAELKDKRWVVNAKMDAGTAGTVNAFKNDERRSAQRAMVLVMLEDRFGLQSHVETKDGPVYALVQVKSGAKLKQTAAVDGERPRNADGSPGRGGSMEVETGLIEGKDVPISALTNVLQAQLRRKVVDKTGLAGRYDMTVKWRRDADGGNDDGPALETALPEQLGLKLESQRGSVPVVVIDHARLPGED